MQEFAAESDATRSNMHTLMPRVALRYAQSVAAVCWQQAASKGYLVYP